MVFCMLAYTNLIDGVPNGQPGVGLCVSRFVVLYQPLSCLTLVLHTVGGPALKSLSV